MLLPWTASTILIDLGGVWSYARQIEEMRHRTFLGSSHGCLTVTPTPGRHHHYREEGVLRLADGYSAPARRDYFLIQSDQDLTLYFDEALERPFHSLSLAPWETNGVIAIGQHECGGDSYASIFHFRGDGRFSIDHQVAGPRKDYVSRTVFTRVVDERMRAGRDEQ